MLRPAALANLPVQVTLLQLFSVRVVELTQTVPEKQRCHKLNVLSPKVNSSFVKQVIMLDGHRTYVVSRQYIFLNFNHKHELDRF